MARRQRIRSNVRLNSCTMAQSQSLYGFSVSTLSLHENTGLSVYRPGQSLQSGVNDILRLTKLATPSTIAHLPSYVRRLAGRTCIDGDLFLLFFQSTVLTKLIAKRLECRRNGLNGPFAWRAAGPEEQTQGIGFPP